MRVEVAPGVRGLAVSQPMGVTGRGDHQNPSREGSEDRATSLNSRNMSLAAWFAKLTTG